MYFLKNLIGKIQVEKTTRSAVKSVSGKPLPLIMASVALFGASLWFAFCLPDPLFDVPYSPVMYDRNGAFLNAQTAQDEQWRFSSSGNVNQKFAAALIEYEDKRFMRHIGVDIIAVGRAALQNIRA